MHFSDYFGVPPESLDDYGAFNISLTTDLPLFIDPFLLFASLREDYQALHAEIIRYLEFLRDRAEQGAASDGQLKAWYHFPEVSETWLGFTKNSNRGRGLGAKFARIAPRGTPRTSQSGTPENQPVVKLVADVDAAWAVRLPRGDGQRLETRETGTGACAGAAGLVAAADPA